MDSKEQARRDQRESVFWFTSETSNLQLSYLTHVCAAMFLGNYPAQSIVK